MKLSVLMIINTIIAGVFGIAFVLVPAKLLSFYGMTAGAGLIFMGHLLGAALIGFAVLTWSARNTTDSDAGRAIVLALFIADAIGFILALKGQLAGIANELGWSTVVIYLLLALGFGYFRFVKPSS